MKRLFMVLAIVLMTVVYVGKVTYAGPEGNGGGCGGGNAGGGCGR
jgi:hypothetical protein